MLPRCLVLEGDWTAPGHTLGSDVQEVEWSCSDQTTLPLFGASELFGAFAVGGEEVPLPFKTKSEVADMLTVKKRTPCQFVLITSPADVKDLEEENEHLMTTSSSSPFWRLTCPETDALSLATI